MIIKWVKSEAKESLSCTKFHKKLHIFIKKFQILVFIKKKRSKTSCTFWYYK